MLRRNPWRTGSASGSTTRHGASARALVIEPRRSGHPVSPNTLRACHGPVTDRWQVIAARDVLDGTVPPVTPRDAATVMLLRPAAGGQPEGGEPGLQVYMLRRRSSMAFAAGAYVFPGGSVDPADADEGIPWAGPDAREWGRRLDAPAELARILVCAAVRETFEESGVLLAGPDTGTVLATTGDAQWEADRRNLLAGSLSLAELLRRRGLLLRSDLLRPWARWITPVTEASRSAASRESPLSPRIV